MTKPRATPIPYGSVVLAAGQPSGGGLTRDTLNRIGALANKVLTLEARIAKGQELLADLGKQRARILEDLLPGIFDEAGVKDVTLDTGEKIAVKPDIRANIKMENREAANKWLRSNGFGSLIKTEVAVRFGMGKEQNAVKLYAQLEKKFHEHATMSEAVHTSSLRSFVTERLAKGDELPPSIGVASLPVAIIKKGN